MNILFLSRAYGLHSGGMERLSYELIQSVKKQDRTQVQVITHSGSRRTSPLFNLTALPQALTAARQADVIHIGDPVLSFAGWMLKKLTGKPVVVTVHGLDIMFPSALYQLYLKLFFTHFDGYFPISRHVQSLLISKFNIPNSNLNLLTPGITDQFYDPTLTRQALSSLLHRNISDSKIFFTSGRLVKRKGHAWFIREVLPHLPEQSLYVIAGQGPEAADITQASEEAGVAERVILLGKVSSELLKILYNTVDAFVMPNIPVKNDVEGFGLVLLEAALCNRPIFAAELNGIPDAIHNGKNGTLLPSQQSEAWIKALQNISPLLSREYTLQRFGWDKATKSYIDALSAVGK